MWSTAADRRNAEAIYAPALALQASERARLQATPAFTDDDYTSDNVLRVARLGLPAGIRGRLIVTSLAGDIAVFVPLNGAKRVTVEPSQVYRVEAAESAA